jgi:hypothetical protein
VAACDDGARAKLTSGGGATQAVPGRSSRAAVVGHGRRAGEDHEWRWWARAVGLRRGSRRRLGLGAKQECVSEC